jgi:hypothetical protein
MALNVNHIKFILVAIIIGIIIIQIWNIPRTNLANTIEPNRISGPLYRGEAGAFDQFYLNYKFKNTGRTTVEIKKLEPKILLNGTNYNSQQTTHKLTTIPSGSETELVRIVQLSNAPIGYIEGQNWNITVVTEISGESDFLLFGHSLTITDVTSVDWETHIFE